MEFPVYEFLTQQEHELAARCRTYQAMSNNVSAIGHPCVRYLVYKRTRGEEAVPVSTDLQSLFDEGNAQEESTISKIKTLGYKYERSQESFGFKDLEIRGKIDGVAIKVVGGKIVGKWASEIKKVSAYAWDSINVWEDLLKNWWQAKYVTQLQLAILHVSTKEGFDDSGVFFLKHTEKNLVKPISMPMRQDIIDAAFDKARSVNAHMKSGTDPERCDYTLGICEKCEFNAICGPESQFLAGENITSQEFIGKLRRRETLHEESKEFDRLDKDIKETLRGKTYALAGPFRITGKEYGKGWKVDIERVMSDDDMEKMSPAIQIPVQNPVSVRQEHPDLASFRDRIAMARTTDQLNVIREDFKAVHSKTPFSEPEMGILQSEFKPAYVRLKKMSALAGNGVKTHA